MENHILIPGHLSHLSYVLLPGSPYSTGDSKTKQLHEAAYVYWKNFWTQVFIENGDRRTLTSDDFMRQDLITLLLYDGKIIGMHLYSFFDVSAKATRDHSYFIRGYTERYFNFLKEAQVKTAMSWEYLTVDKSWRKNKVGISFARVLVGMAAKIQTLLAIDASIAVSRNDVKVTEICEQYGAKVIVPQFQMHNTPCSLIAGLKDDIVESRDESIRKTIEALWSRRLDLSGENFFSDFQTIKKVG